jgi:hypothetical protein
MDQTIKSAIETFAKAIEQLIAEHVRAHYEYVTPGTIEIDWGRRYARIVRRGDNGGPDSRCVHCFVDTTNGDVLKAASWKGPAKGIRGNVLSGDRMGSVTPNGTVYWR